MAAHLYNVPWKLGHCLRLVAIDQGQEVAVPPVTSGIHQQINKSSTNQITHKNKHNNVMTKATALDFYRSLKKVF